MAVLHKQVILPLSLTELFSAWSRNPDAVPFAGGTSLLSSQSRDIPELPENILSLDKIDELSRITRTERYLEIGAMVKLSEIIALGKIVPDALTRTLQGIAGPQLRILATIGGNICALRDSIAPLAALDARFELRTAAQSRWISAIRFASIPGGLLNAQELLTRIRIPLEQWNFTRYKKFKSSDLGDEPGGVLIFLANNQKNLLTDIRMVFFGKILLRDKNSESFLAGKELPLNRKDAAHYRQLWETYLSGMGKPGPLLRVKLTNTIESEIQTFAD